MVEQPCGGAAQASRLEGERSEANKRYVDAMVPRVLAGANGVPKYPVEQAEGIATDEHATLVLAGDPRCQLGVDSGPAP